MPTHAVSILESERKQARLAERLDFLGDKKDDDSLIVGESGRSIADRMADTVLTALFRPTRGEDTYRHAPRTRKSSVMPALNARHHPKITPCKRTSSQ